MNNIYLRTQIKKLKEGPQKEFLRTHGFDAFTLIFSFCETGEKCSSAWDPLQIWGEFTFTRENTV